jgi:hypothetical protein
MWDDGVNWDRQFVGSIIGLEAEQETSPSVTNYTCVLESNPGCVTLKQATNGLSHGLASMTQCMSRDECRQ